MMYESFISYSFQTAASYSRTEIRQTSERYPYRHLLRSDGTEAMNELRYQQVVLTLDIDGNKVELTEEDLLIETAQTEGYVTEADGDISVVLDTNLTPELIEEGFVREIVSKDSDNEKRSGI